MRLNFSIVWAARINSSAPHNHFSRENFLLWIKYPHFFSVRKLFQQSRIEEPGHSYDEKKTESHFRVLFYSVIICLFVRVCARAVVAYYASFFKYKINKNIPLFSSFGWLLFCALYFHGWFVLLSHRLHIIIQLGSHCGSQANIFKRVSFRSWRLKTPAQTCYSRTHHHLFVFCESWIHFSNENSIITLQPYVFVLV